MRERIKDMAWSVKLSVIFLLTCYIIFLCLAPGPGIVLTFCMCVLAAVGRIINYLIDGR